MHELLANHMVRWQQEKMCRPEWQHQVALATRPVTRPHRVTAGVQRLRTRRARLSAELEPPAEAVQVQRSVS